MASSSAARVRRYRERRRLASEARSPLLFERPDWRLFIEPHTLPQKAGCEPDQIGRAVVKELTDNALDSGANNVTVEGNVWQAAVRDDGPGIEPEQITRVFSVNRPLVSSKLKRLPTRGMLGNGLRVVMGAVAAFKGKIAVTSRGVRYELATDTVTGETKIVGETVLESVGTAVEIRFARKLFAKADFDFARSIVAVAGLGSVYAGFSQRAWYSRQAVEQLIAAAPKDATVREITQEVFGVSVDNIDFLPIKRFDPVEIGEMGAVLPGWSSEIGETAVPFCYRIIRGTTEIEGAAIPFCVEAWVDANTADSEGDDDIYTFSPFINRTLTLAQLSFWADREGFHIYGCGLNFKIAGAKRANYKLKLSIISPLVQLTSDGKTPFLGDFREAIEKAVGGAAREAYQRMVRPPSSMSIKEAAARVMRAAYMKASSDGTRMLPAKARQIMYAARGEILRLTGAKKFNEDYFTQTLLPDYLTEHPEETANWDVVYDARGNLTEPHTRRRVLLGTIQVRTYLGKRAPLGPAVRINPATLYPTVGPENRFDDVLFIEKEGFDELWEAVQLSECYDLGIMSTKGMSVVAARKLIDSLAKQGVRIFVLRDFDVSGFSIFGTLGTNSRRYTFENDMSGKIIDIGLRLEDVQALQELGLEAEKVEVDNPWGRRDKLRSHGATEAEIAFLAEPDDDGMCQRVELNAMTSPQLVEFVERKLNQYGVAKVVPEDNVIAAHARRVLERALTEKAIEDMAEEIQQEAANIDLPPDLADQIGALLAERPALSWDQAAAEIVESLASL
jgi:hypothetical protein